MFNREMQSIFTKYIVKNFASICIFHNCHNFVQIADFFAKEKTATPGGSGFSGKISGR